jgi:hypothetical protein
MSHYGSFIECRVKFKVSLCLYSRKSILRNKNDSLGFKLQ